MAIGGQSPERAQGLVAGDGQGLFRGIKWFWGLNRKWLKWLHPGRWALVGYGLLLLTYDLPGLCLPFSNPYVT